ncbi:MAG: hypothetical protein QXW00_04315 [Candidatus Woesearchaeota archaeon]
MFDFIRRKEQKPDFSERDLEEILAALDNQLRPYSRYTSQSQLIAGMASYLKKSVPYHLRDDTTIRIAESFVKYLKESSYREHSALIPKWKEFFKKYGYGELSEKL